MSIKNKTPKNSWYCNSRPKIQIGLYEVFVDRKRLSVEKLKALIDEFYEKKTGQKKFPHTGRAALDTVTFYFTEFLEFVKTKENMTFKKRPKKKKYRDTYSDWWEECNMDGSFAYNNASDDF